MAVAEKLGVDVAVADWLEVGWRDVVWFPVGFCKGEDVGVGVGGVIPLTRST